MTDEIRHLDEGRLAQLLSGALQGAEADALASHLDAGCERCEAFLAGRPTGGLDGAADAAALGLAPAGEAGSDLEWARIRKAIAGRRPLRAAMPVAVAAAALVALAVGLRSTTEPFAPSTGAWDGVKGTEATAPARLQFSIALPGSSGPVVERGASGAVVSGRASLLFRAEARGPAALALLHLGSAGAEPLWEGRAQRAGPVDMEVGGKPAAFSLAGLSGRQRFALVAAPALGRELVARVGQQLAAGGAHSGEMPVGVDIVEVTVR